MDWKKIIIFFGYLLQPCLEILWFIKKSIIFWNCNKIFTIFYEKVVWHNIQEVLLFKHIKDLQDILHTKTWKFK
jgi:hypothetical protein